MNKGYKLGKNNKFYFVSFNILDDEGVLNTCTGKWLINQGKKEIFSFSKKQSPEILKKNIDILQDALKIKPDIVTACQQVHGNDVVIVDDAISNRNDKFFIFDSKDAMITRKKNTMLLITTADCVPIFLFDKKKRIIANIHAGWRSTHQNILGYTIDIMKTKFDVKSRDILVCLGPAIGQCCFEVGNHVASLFKDDYGSKYLKYNTKSGKNHVDLKSVNQDIALSHSIPKENIFICDICTCCNEDFYSYRRDGLIGLSANILSQ